MYLGCGQNMQAQPRCVWWVVPAPTEGLRCTMTANGEQCAMISLTTMMHKLSARLSDSHGAYSHTFTFYFKYT